MQNVVDAVSRISLENATPNAVEAFRAAAVEFAKYGLTNLRGDLLIRALDVSRSMAEFANFFDIERGNDLDA